VPGILPQGYRRQVYRQAKQGVFEGAGILKPGIQNPGASSQEKIENIQISS
jgi:hypothetical protein